MRELRCEVAIVGKQEHASGVAVETSDGIDALGAGILDKVHNGLALLRVVAGGDIVLRLVEEDIDLLLDADGLVVEAYLVGAEHLGAQLRNNLSVDSDDAGLYELIGLTTAADTGIGEELVQTYRLVGVEVLLFVLNAFLQRILGIGIIGLTVGLVVVV